MSSIGGRIMVNLIDDGSQLHAVLLCNTPLTQSWTGSAADPDWTVAANQPVIYLDAKSGIDRVTVGAFSWYYNNQLIQFTGNTSNDGKFQMTTYEIETGVTVPALKIIGNLAANGNVDEDTIAFSGTATINGTNVPFRSVISIRISSFSENGGYNAYIDSKDNGGFAIDKDHSSLILYNVLKQAGASGIATIGASAYVAEWYINGSKVTDNSKVGTVTIDGVTYSKLTVAEADITDYAIIECKCFKLEGGSKGAYLLSAFVEVNDLTDPEMMYVSSTISGAGITTSQTTETGEGNENTLRNGQQVNYDVFVAKAEDVTSVFTSYAHFYIQLRTAQNAVYTAALSGADLGSPIASGDFAGFRKLVGSGAATGHGKFLLTAAHVAAMGRKMSGYLLASTEELPTS